MNFAKIVLLSVGFAILYGVIHDLFTAHLCVEYFSLGHPRLFLWETPLALALGWGVVATWWVGFLLGVPLAIAANVGSKRQMTASELTRPVLLLLAAMGTLAAISWVFGYLVAGVEPSRTFNVLGGGERARLFFANRWAHAASYAAGSMGAIALVIWTWVARLRLKQTEAVQNGWPNGALGKRIVKALTLSAFGAPVLGVYCVYTLRTGQWIHWAGLLVLLVLFIGRNKSDRLVAMGYVTTLLVPAALAFRSVSL